MDYCTYYAINYIHEQEQTIALTAGCEEWYKLNSIHHLYSFQQDGTTTAIALIPGCQDWFKTDSTHLYPSHMFI